MSTATTTDAAAVARKITLGQADAKEVVRDVLVRHIGTLGRDLWESPHGQPRFPRVRDRVEAGEDVTAELQRCAADAMITFLTTLVGKTFPRAPDGIPGLEAAIEELAALQ